MVLRDFGIDVSQQQIWDEIKTPVSASNPNEFRIETRHLASYARKNGLETLVGRLREPLEFLEKLRNECGYRFILNHRIRPDSPLGHFTVFVQNRPEENAEILHDPQKGPERIIVRDELAELWKPFGENCEITGNIGVLFFQNDVDCLTDSVHWAKVFDEK